jgi:uracil-DNA glycosylase
LDPEKIERKRIEHGGNPVPRVNKFGGWYGGFADPGDVRVMIIGESHYPGHESWPPLFFGRSGTFLFDQLRRIHVSWHDCYFTNAIKLKGKRDDLMAEINEVQPEHIVVLGRVAEKKLKKIGVSASLYRVIPHPSYWLRFRFSERNQYAKLLQEAIT